jgi:acryloyl-coenzyme A reductase
MQAIVLRAFGSPDNLRPETVPDPAPGPGEVLMRVHACGVCHHDVINRRGNLPRTAVPAILGHEAAGEVVAVGPGVLDWFPGDRAATLQRLSCGECSHCHAERNSLCRNDTRFFGEEIPGGYAAYMAAPVAGLGQAELHESFRLVASGELRSWVSDVLPLHEASRAHDRLEKRQVAGRLVLEPVH